MSNNLQRAVLAPAQTSNQYVTVNSSIGGVDAAMTAKLAVIVSTAGSYTVNLLNLTTNLEFVLTNHATPPVAPFNIVLDNTASPSNAPRGLIIVTNKTSFTATVSAIGQVLPAVPVLAGYSSLIYLTSTDAILISAGATGYVLKTGDTMTGPLVVPAGSAGTPGLGVGAANDGIYQISAGNLGFTFGGVQGVAMNATCLSVGAGALTNQTLALRSTGALALSMFAEGEATVGYQFRRISSDASSSTITMSKARGTIASFAPVALNDAFGFLNWSGASTTAAFVTAIQMRGNAIAATPSATDMAARLSTFMCPAASVTLTEIQRLEHATGMSMFGANIVIDLNRDFRLRSYTIATTPAHVAGKTIYCSDLGGGGAALVSDGSKWQRTNAGEQTVATDADFTLTWLTNAQFQKHTGTLTANRVITLATTNASAGDWFEVTRTGGGAFTLDVGGLILLTASGTYARVAYDGAAWYLSAPVGTVQKAGDTMTGALIVPAGLVGTPGIGIGAANDGIYSTGAGSLGFTFGGVQGFRANANGIGIGADPTSALPFYMAMVGGTLVAAITADGEAGVNNNIRRFSTNLTGPVYGMRKARGTIASPAVVVQNDQMGLITFGYQNVTGPNAFTVGAEFRAIIIAATPSTTDGESRMQTFLTPAASVVSTEFWRQEHALGMSMFGANVVIDQNRNFRLRSYTLGTLPTNVAGLALYCSDLGGGGGELVGDGTSWKRSSTGEQTVATDVNFTLTSLTSAQFQKHTGTLTANRTITLATTNASAGDFFKVTRTGGGAFTLSVGGLFLLSQNQWAKVVYDGAAWYLADKGYLDTPANIGFFYPGVPPVSAKIWGMVTTFAFTLADQYVGSQGYCDTAPGATITFDVKKNGTNIGTMVFTSANTATFTNIAAGADSFAVGDRLAVHTPAAVSTLADLQVMFKGIRTD